MSLSFLRVVLTAFAFVLGLVVSAAAADDFPYKKWPVPLSDSDFLAKIDSIRLEPRGVGDFEKGKSIYRGIIAFGAATHSWNPQFKQYDLEQGLTSRLKYFGLKDGIVLPMLESINLAYQVLPPKEAENHASVVLYGLEQLSPDTAAAVKRGMKIQPVNFSPAGQMDDFRAQFQSIDEHLKKSMFKGADIKTSAYEKSEMGANIQSFMPFQQNPYSVLANPYLGPGSIFERATGYAVEGTRSADGRQVAPYEEIAVQTGRADASSDPKNEVSPERRKAGIEAAKCITVCFTNGMKMAGITRTGGKFTSTPEDMEKILKNPVKAGAAEVAYIATAAYLSTAGCTLVVCAKEVEKVTQEKAKEEEKKKEDASAKVQEERKQNCEIMSSAECEKQKEEDKKNATFDCSKMSSAECEKKKTEQNKNDKKEDQKNEVKTSPLTTPNPTCQEEGTNCGDSADRSPKPDCRQNSENESCLLSKALAGCDRPGASDCPPTVATQSTDDDGLSLDTLSDSGDISLNDRNEQIAALPESVRLRVGLSLNEISPEIAAKAVLTDQERGFLREVLQERDAVLQLRPELRGALLEQIRGLP